MLLSNVFHLSTSFFTLPFTFSFLFFLFDPTLSHHPHFSFPFSVIFLFFLLFFLHFFLHPPSNIFPLFLAQISLSFRDLFLSCTPLPAAHLFAGTHLTCRSESVYNISVNLFRAFMLAEFPVTFIRAMESRFHLSELGEKVLIST